MSQHLNKTIPSSKPAGPNRRQFVRSSALAGTAILAAGAVQPLIASASPSNSPKDEFGGFPIGVQSYSLRNFNTAEAVRHINGLGLKYVEFYSKHMNPAGTAEHLAEVKALCKKAGISINAHGVSSFTKDHDANRKTFEFAKRAGIKNITANPQKDSFDSLDKLCEEFKIRICIHNHGPGALYDKISDVSKMVKDRHPLIGACIDTGHFIRSKEDPVQAVYDLKGRVFALHVKDEEKREKRSRNVVIGTGHLDLVALFKALRETKFPEDGSVSLEYEANPNNPIEDMKQCVVQAKKAIAKL